MRVFVLALLLVVCVSAGLFDSDKDGFGNKLEGLFGGNITKRMKKTFDRMKNVYNMTKLLKIREKLNGLKEKIRAKLTLTPHQKEALEEQLKFFKRKQVDQIQEQGDSIQEINRRSGIGKLLYQGDMVLTETQADEIVANANGRSRRQAFRDGDYPSNIWSFGVYYYFDKSADEKIKSVFKKGANLWSKDSCVNFFENSRAADRIRVGLGAGCSAPVGNEGGVQRLSLGDGCQSIEVAAHEIGHCLGFWHTHERHDRDKFITINLQNVKDGWASDFGIQTPATNDNYGIPYDYGSIMHYASKSSSKNLLPTMVPKDGQYIETLGSPFVSFYDLLMLNTHYNCLGKCDAKTPAKCQMGGFPNPRDCKKCVCPGGYGGALCDQKPDGCGSELTATKKWQRLVDKLGDKIKGQVMQEDFMFCNYWIKAPAGKRVEIQIISLSKGIDTDGCDNAGVEVKTNADQRLTGYRFCSVAYAGTLLTSTSNVVPIITYSRYFAKVVTKLRYRFV